ncbi:uncharacterized protein LOC144766801 isoform X2 [Lissotriton helveticus]
MGCEIPFLLCLITTTSIDGLRRLTASESQDVRLPCCTESPSSSTPTEAVWRKKGDAGPLLQVWLSLEVATSMGTRLEMIGNHRPYLLLRNLSVADSGVYKCFSGPITGGSFLLNISSQGEQYIAGFSGSRVQHGCSKNSSISFEESPTRRKIHDGVLKTINNGSKCILKRTSLVIKNLTKKDKGCYYCQLKNRTTRTLFRLKNQVEGFGPVSRGRDHSTSRSYPNQGSRGSFISNSQDYKPQFYPQRGCGFRGRGQRNFRNNNQQDYLELTFPVGASVYLPCGFSNSSNWTTYSWQSVKGSFNLDENFSVTIEVHPGARPLGAALFKTIDLLIPAVRPEDAGVYNCSWGDNSDIIELEVIALSKWRKIFRDSYWIIIAGTGGSLALSAFIWGICLVIIKQIEARRKRPKTTSRSFFRITASSTPNTYIDVPAVFTDKGKKTHDEDGGSYMNVDLGQFEEDPKNLRRKDIVSDDSFNVTSEGEGSYVQPNDDNSEDGNCYENTNEEVKPCPKGSKSDGTVLFRLNEEQTVGVEEQTVAVADGICYENPAGLSKVVKDYKVAYGGACYENSEQLPITGQGIISDGICYENPAGLSKVVKDYKVAYGGACYENSEQLPITGQGIISGFLAPTPSNSVGTADGVSEKSTGSQSYEEMEGAVFMVPVRNLQQCSDRSQEDDGDSYENMDGQTFTVHLNQRTPRIEEEYDNMDKDSHLTVHSEDQTNDANTALATSKTAAPRCQFLPDF